MTPARIPPPFRDSDAYAELDAVTIDDEPEIPIDDLLEEPFEEFDPHEAVTRLERPPLKGPTMTEGPLEHIIQFFAHAHLPAHLQEVSAPFATLAESLLALPRNPERTVALRKLLEAKDAAVRARLAK